MTVQWIAEPTAHLYLEIMATRDEPPGTYAADLASVKASAVKVERARAKLREVEQEAREDVARALASGLAEGVTGFRAAVQQASPFSPPVVRAIGEKARIAPDDRYVRSVSRRTEP